MKREDISFTTFKENFIKQPDGFFPVYSAIKENDDGYQSVVEMDMICEWRLTDGKVRFIEVPFSSDEEYEEIKGYLKVTADLLNKAILENIDGLEEYKDHLEKVRSKLKKCSK